MSIYLNKRGLIFNKESQTVDTDDDDDDDDEKNESHRMILRSSIKSSI